jgi:hypothetical protein
MLERCKVLIEDVSHRIKPPVDAIFNKQDSLRSCLRGNSLDCALPVFTRRGWGSLGIEGIEIPVVEEPIN